MHYMLACLRCRAVGLPASCLRPAHATRVAARSRSAAPQRQHRVLEGRRPCGCSSRLLPRDQPARSSLENERHARWRKTPVPLIFTPTSLADFNSDRDCCGRGAGGWRCEGDGLDDARFTFVAPPSAANRLLQTLSYRSVATDVRDVVSVEVFDGVGGECLHSHNTASIRDGCFRRNASLTIYVASYALFEQHAAAAASYWRRRQPAATPASTAAPSSTRLHLERRRAAASVRRVAPAPRAWAAAEPPLTSHRSVR